jgi:tetratricopeptide (TPR) repeat protein
VLVYASSCRSSKTASKTDPIEAKQLSNEVSKQFAYTYVTACSERMKGNLDEALKLFNQCATLDPSNIAVKYELATIYRLLGVNDQALKYAKISAEGDPSNEWYQLLLIECHNILKQYNQSIKLRENLVRNFPAKPEFKEDLAYQYSIMGHYEKAIKIYEELERQLGLNEQISLNKSRLFKTQKKFKEAELELQKLVDKNPFEPRMYSYLAEFYLEQNDFEKAKKMYDKILEVDPSNPVVNLALHDYYSTQGKTAEAFEHLKKAFLNPDLDVYTKDNIVQSFLKRIDGPDGSMYRTNGSQLSAIMLKVHPQSAESNAAYADFLVLERKNREAIPYYYKAAMAEKNNLKTWSQLLRLEYEAARYDSLEKHSSIAMEVFPNSANVYFFNGLANIQLRNYKKAAQSLKDGLEFVLDNKSLMIDFYASMGDAYYYLQEFEKSDKAFENALKIDSDNTFVLNQYAYYLSLRKDNLERAEKLSRKANELSPDNRSYMDTYGWILYQQKKYNQSEEWLARAARLGPKNPTILEHYGDVLFRLNKVSEAVQQWEAAKAAGGNQELLNKKIKEKVVND